MAMTTARTGGNWDINMFKRALPTPALRPGALVMLRGFLAGGGDPDTSVHRVRYRGLLAASADWGWDDAVRLLIAAGATVGANQNEALRLASGPGHLSIVERLLAAGADVHAKNDEALYQAALHSRTLVIRRLLAAGANVHAGQEKALRHVIIRNDWTVVERLIAAGADVHIRNEAALAIALRQGLLETARVLLRHGANVVVAWRRFGAQKQKHMQNAVAAVLDTIAADIPDEQRRALIQSERYRFPALRALLAAEQRQRRRIVCAPRS